MRSGTGVSLFDCINVRMEGGALYGAPGFGITAQQCHDLTFRGLRLVPRPGRHFGPLRDGIHGIENTGRVVVEDCEFRSIGDDALNFHNDSFDAFRGNHSRQLLISNRFEYRSGQHASYLGFATEFRPGDVIEFLRRQTYEPYGGGAVLSAAHDPVRFANGIRLELRHPVPLEFEDGDFVWLSARMAQVTIRNCQIHNTAAHGLRMMTRGTLIENCKISHTHGPAIDINPAFGVPWSEVGHADQVTVRGCEFRDNGLLFRSGKGWGVCTRTELPEPAVGLHRHVVLEDNRFISNSAGPAINLACVEDARVRGNTFECPPPYIHMNHARRLKFRDLPEDPNAVDEGEAVSEIDFAG